MLEHLFIRKHLALLLLLPFLVGTNLDAADMPFSGKSSGKALEPSTEKSNAPLSITSDKMVFQSLKDKIIFEGSVVIKKEGLLLESDHAEIFLTGSKTSSSASLLSEEGKEGQQVSKIIASGNVRIKRGSQQAKAEKGIFDRVNDVIILSGNPELWEAGYRIKGREITFFVNEERTLVAESEVVIQNTAGGLNLGKK